MTIPITLTCADYPRIMPIATGAVKPEGIDLTFVLGQAGSWGSRAEMLSRALNDPTVQGGEQSMARHLLRVDRGDRSHVALPAFPLRNLTARDIYVRRDGPVRAVADLTGKRAGMYSWSASGSIWYRHLLRFLGVEQEALTWFIGNIDSPEWAVPEPDLPSFVNTAPQGKALAQMLADGEIDVLFSPPRPKRFGSGDGPIVRLFPDYRPIEMEYVRKFNVWPPQHLFVIRREAWLANKSIARSLTDAFVRSNEVYAAQLRSFPYVTPWMEADLEASEPVLSLEAHADGLEANRHAIDLFCAHAHHIGLTRRRVTVEEYFAEYLES